MIKDNDTKKLTFLTFKKLHYKIYIYINTYFFKITYYSCCFFGNKGHLLFKATGAEFWIQFSFFQVGSQTWITSPSCPKLDHYIIYTDPVEADRESNGQTASKIDRHVIERDSSEGKKTVMEKDDRQIMSGAQT